MLRHITLQLSSHSFINASDNALFIAEGVGEIQVICKSFSRKRLDWRSGDFHSTELSTEAEGEHLDMETGNIA